MKKILIQLDTDPRPSVFDRVVAVDAGADEVFSYGNIAPGDVRDLVYGAIFTRGGDDLRNTAVFIGGSDVDLGEKVLEAASGAFLGPLRVSLMLDSSGANTTASAAVIAVSRHIDVAGATALVLGGTGPVGKRVARLLAGLGATVRLASRSRDRAEAACEGIRSRHPDARVEPVVTAGDDVGSALEGVAAVVSAGSPGVTLLPAAARTAAGDLRVAVDLNAVPPAGIEGIEATDKKVERGRVVCYGAIGVGGTKMKIHRAAVAALFQRDDRTLDAEEILEIGRSL